jgi:hypothetical protein
VINAANFPEAGLRNDKLFTLAPRLPEQSTPAKCNVRSTPQEITAVYTSRRYRAHRLNLQADLSSAAVARVPNQSMLTHRSLRGSSR